MWTLEHIARAIRCYLLHKTAKWRKIRTETATFDLIWCEACGRTIGTKTPNDKEP